MKRSHFRPFAILLGILVCAAGCLRVMMLWDQNPDAYWPPKHLAPSFDAVTDRVELYVGTEPVVKLIAEKRLLLAGKGEPAPLAAAQLTASVNGYERARVARIPELMLFSALAGAGLVLFLIGLFAPLISVFRQEEIVDLHLTT